MVEEEKRGLEMWDDKGRKEGKREEKKKEEEDVVFFFFQAEDGIRDISV